MVSDIASRIRTKFLRRRQSSTTPSLISSRSATSCADTDSHNKSRWQGDHSPLSTARNSGSDEHGSMLVVDPVKDVMEHKKGEKNNAVTIVDEAGGEKAEETRQRQSQRRQSLVSGASNGDPLEQPLEEKEPPMEVHQQPPPHAAGEQEQPPLAPEQLEVAPAEETQQSNSDLRSAGTTAGAPAGAPPAGATATPATSSQPSTSQLSHPPHLTLRPTPSASRLHSIDEGNSNSNSNGNGNGSGSNVSPVTAPSLDDHPLSPRSYHDDRRNPGPLELNLVVSNHYPDSTPSVQASNVNTPAAVQASYFNSQAPVRRQSIISHRQSGLIKSLLHGPPTAEADDTLNSLDLAMVQQTRKIWVKRPHASATSVTISEEDLVDDVREIILRKYGNSLGRTFDSPDLTLRIVPRDESQKERILGPEEPMVRTIDSHYPGGQTINESLIIDIPRRTPKPSPHPTAVYVTDDGRPPEAGDGYFPPVGGSPHHQVAVPAPTNGTGSSHPHSIAVLGTGHIPPIPQIPSPGGTRQRAHLRADRPRIALAHTSSSPNVANSGQGAPPDPNTPHGMQHFTRRPSHSRAHSNTSDHKSLTQSAGPPMPTSPIAQAPQARVATPPPRVSSPRPSTNRVKKVKSKTNEFPGLQGILSGGVPPISVLIVEDNPINLKLLEAFVKRLKVRWQTAMNGRDAVKKWRTGGFHLVLMDIQLPVMNGLDATREIRRLERVNSIGVFSSSPPDCLLEEGESGEINEQDRLLNIDHFKSPVIIVALTASSLQSDRHEALAAGCNDFLTKPVNFVWLERKVMEWGCMQALIDFDGWREWKDFSQKEEDQASKKAAALKAKGKKKSSLSSSTG